MTNTMIDLRTKVSSMLRDSLHGRQIDTIEMGTPEIPHMLGIVPVGAISTEKVESGTILDPSHNFWDDYERKINTRNGVKKEVRSALKSLKEDGKFTVTSPYGNDAGIMYVEVEDMTDATPSSIQTTCAGCGATVGTEADLTMNYGQYTLCFEIDCTECDFNERLTNILHPSP